MPRFALLTWVCTAAILGLVFFVGAGISDGPKGPDSGGRPALLALLLVAFVPLFVTRIRLRRFSWLPFLVGFVSVTLPSALWFLVASGRDAAAWSAYGGLQVLRGRQNFNDLGWVIRSISCGGCSDQNTNYGPGIAWLDTWTFHLIQPSFTPVVGFALIILASLALVWLMRNSTSLAWPVLALTAISSSWLLLLDRGNLDVIAFLLSIGAVFIIRRKDSLTWWFVIAAGIWILGTWKFYPFALGVILILALRIRRGWTVLVAFTVATAVFLIANWHSIVASSQGNSDALVIFDFPATGRLPIVARLVKEFSPATNPLLPNVILLLLALLAVSWGWTFAHGIPVANKSEGILAAAGASIFLASTFVAGFGFAYKNAFLLLTIPLIALASKVRSPAMLYSAICMLSLIAISLIVAYSILLVSLASLIAAAFAFGASIRVILANVWPRFVSTQDSVTAA